MTGTTKWLQLAADVSGFKQEFLEIARTFYRKFAVLGSAYTGCEIAETVQHRAPYMHLIRFLSPLILCTYATTLGELHLSNSPHALPLPGPVRAAELDLAWLRKDRRGEDHR